MSEVRNLKAASWSGLERLGDEPACREALLSELASLTGTATFAAAEGQLHLDVPLAVALDHVPASTLRKAVRLGRNYVRLLLRAAATCPDEFAGWAAGPGDLFDLPGQNFQLLANGGIAFDLPDEAGDGGLDDVQQAPLGARIGPDHLAGTCLCKIRGEVEEQHLLRAQALSLNHPEPPVARRAQPPP